jgi:hypothetical protein
MAAFENAGAIRANVPAAMQIAIPSFFICITPSEECVADGFAAGSGACASI